MGNVSDEYAHRHPQVQSLLGFFDYSHLPEHLQSVSRVSASTARHVVQMLPDGPELTAGLRKLLEAKDCFVRAAITSGPDESPTS